MTAANEFIETDEELEASGPSIFGLTLTPRVIGILIGVLGALLALFGLIKLVLPAINRGSQLKAEIDAKVEEIKQQEERLSKLGEAQEQLAEAQQRRAAVTGLLADEDTLETLLFDLEEQIDRQINANVEGDNNKARITSFEPIVPQTPEQEIVNDSSFGAAANGKLRRREYNAEFEGSFPQTRQFMIILERMQPMLVVQDVNMQLADGESVVEGNYQQGQFVKSDQQPQRRVTTSFQLEALMPLSQEELQAEEEAAEQPQEGEEAPAQ
ncbi:MAG: pilus assembly protein PilO [Microcoleaceae cyanobacterium]